ncbi:hypothetical protein NECAME_06013 [Necator americanus]|uniref:Uncharacterized protein n=1 Tax=Necator americanus TaxID=51031 RepID=W2TZ25_NECAM|nr:hypothetical protein NECAME_06013 [Necator americanus]ETN86306.1 hypothetical protein NECAME_06013 [Necator americanus]
MHVNPDFSARKSQNPRCYAFGLDGMRRWTTTPKREGEQEIIISPVNFNGYVMIPISNSARSEQLLLIVN